MSFEKRGAVAALAAAEEMLQFRFGHPRFRQEQRPVVEAMLQGSDLLAVLPTGAGKSACFQVPALVLPGLTVVVSPLVSLMRDQVEGLRRRTVSAAALTSATGASARREIAGRMARGDLRLLYVSPERLELARFRHLAQLAGISRLVVDEAHCISEWGHDFRPAYRRIRAFAELVGCPPLAAFTATATPQTRTDIERSLGLRCPRRFVASVDRPELRWVAAPASDFGAALRRAGVMARRTLAQRREAAVVIYSLTRARAVRTAEALRRLGLAAAPYHAGMPDAARRRVQERFLNGRFRVICATSAFGMGIDHPHIRLVCHLGAPPSVEAYVQEAGRAGRNGEEATCLLLGLPGDASLHRRLLLGQWPPFRIVRAVWNELPGDRATGEARVRQRLCRRHDPESVEAALRVLRDAGCVWRSRRGAWPSSDIGSVGAGRIARISAPGPNLARRLARGRRRGRRRAQAMRAYLDTRGCRRASIARYFGEPAPRCGSCDNCR